MKGDWLMALDAGGSFIKFAMVDTAGNVMGGVRQSSVDSAAESEAILSAYASAVSALMVEAENRGLPLGLGIASPGPFDYQNGKSLMTHKFASLYGMDLRGEITKRCGLPVNTKIAFVHDANAFLLGEYWVGAARGYHSAAAVTLGTGVGYACIENGNLLVNGMGSPYLSLYLQRWGNGMLEDVASARGIVNAYAARRPDTRENGMLDAQAVSLRATRGDQDAAAAFEQLGHSLGTVLTEPLSKISAQCLVLGGQISRSYDLFKDELLKGLAGVPSLEKVCTAENLESSTLYGAACALFSGLNENGSGNGAIRYKRVP